MPHRGHKKKNVTFADDLTKPKENKLNLYTMYPHACLTVSECDDSVSVSSAPGTFGSASSSSEADTAVPSDNDVLDSDHDLPNSDDHNDTVALGLREDDEWRVGGELPTPPPSEQEHTRDSGVDWDDDDEEERSEVKKQKKKPRNRRRRDLQERRRLTGSWLELHCESS